ncbi:MDR family MFS transporter [Actinoplanes couchii]|uniref:MFS transporter n=1 Tax=Actinoplanes couchii TaxID=403638 RepID=A0ABQ3X7D5_9ACTN|nr:MDR family MFS transporter [Actinoplanes couchii]MDR6322266.1 EmrB/QacA subfamily drug resistance transporter [Actinoplanes couchii]GID54425.1 MFS transporter [Actinoplanes couchii]
MPPNFLLVYAALLVAMLLGALDQTIFSTALPTIVGELHGLEHMAWVTTAYILAATIGMPVYGKLGDLIGHKIVFVAAIGFFVAGSVVAALAGGMPALITGRALQGLGGGGLMIISQAIVADLVPPRERAKFLAPMGAVFGIASVAGPLLGGWFTDQHSWRWAFWINVPLGAVAIGVALFALRLPRRNRTVRLDYPGTALMAVAVTCTVLFATWGGTEYDWSDPIILGLGAAAVATWAAFLLSQRSAAEPIIPLHLFRNSIFVVATLLGMLVVGVAMFAIVGYLPTYLQMVYGVSATESGLLMLPMVVGIMATALTSGALLGRTGKYKIYPIAGTGLLIVFAALVSRIGIDTPLWVICAYLVIAGAGIGLMMQTLVLAVQNAFPQSEVGTVTSANNFFREIGATLGTAVVGAVFASRLTDRLATALPTGGALTDSHSLTPALVRALPETVREAVVTAYADALVPIFGYLIPVLVAGLILAFTLKEKPLATRAEDPEPAAPQPV